MHNNENEKEPLIELNEIGKLSLAWLPNAIIKQIGSFLDIKSLVQLSRVCRGSHALFKTSLTTRNDEKLLSAVMYANPAGVKSLLKILTPSDSECIVLKKVRGVEECGRVWKSVSPIEFAAWAGDTEIVKLLRESVPDAEKTKAVKQLEGVVKNGTEHGKYLAPYCSLIEAYEELARTYSPWFYGELTMLNMEKVCKLSKAQLMLPLVVLQQICGWKGSASIQKFKQRPERSLKLFGSSLLPLSYSGLGDRFALSNCLIGEVERASTKDDRSNTRYHCSSAEEQAVAFKNLCWIRNTELMRIIEKLSKTPEELLADFYKEKISLGK